MPASVPPSRSLTTIDFNTSFIWSALKYRVTRSLSLIWPLWMKLPTPLEKRTARVMGSSAAAVRQKQPAQKENGGKHGQTAIDRRHLFHGQTP